MGETVASTRKQPVLPGVSASASDPTAAGPDDGGPMRIALVGTRGVPANYGGFETAVEEVGKPPRRARTRRHGLLPTPQHRRT